ncbi:MAG: hypothetical protein ACRD5J_08500 [Nitrososphaeraceae archaeon]
MPPRIPESTKSDVVQKWLEPQSRNNVALACGISQGAASGIIDDWKRDIGVSRAEQIRDWAETFERHRISVTQCAQGYRIARLMSDLGVDEDEFEVFVRETYKRCVAVGLQPGQIAYYLADLISFAIDSNKLGIVKEKGDNDPSTIPSIRQIAKFVEEKKEECNKTELRLEQVNNEVKSAEAKKSSIKRVVESMLKERDMTAEKLNWYLDLKTELLISGYSDSDIEVLLKGINFIRESGHNLLALAEKFSIHEKLNSSVRQLLIKESVLEKNLRQLEQKANISEQIIESHSQLQWEMLKLKAMGFGLKKLKRLNNIITEIAEENGFSVGDGYAVKMFFDQIERNYDNVLGLEKRVDDLKAEFNNLHLQHLGQVNILSALPYVGSALAYLLGKGLREDQILELANIVKMHPEIIQSSLKNDNGNNSNNYSTEGQQRTDDIKSVKSSSASAPSSSRLHPASSSSLISSPPSQQASPQISTTPTLLTSAAALLPQTYLTTKLSADGTDTDTKTNIQSIVQPTKSPIKMKDNFSPASVVVVEKPAQDESRYKDSQPVDTRHKDDILNRDLINPYLNQTPTFFGNEVTFPKSIFRNKRG